MKSTKIKRLFLSFITAVFVATSLTSLIPPLSVSAASNPTQINTPCLAVSSGAKSPFSITKDLCLGQASGQQYYQFVVDFPVKVSGYVTVTGKSEGSSPTTMKFVSETATRYVSPEINRTGAGYPVGISSSSSTCNAKDGAHIIDITATANGKSYTLPPVNLCQHTNINDSVIYSVANGITDPGTASTTNILGNLGIFRTDSFVPTNLKQGLLQQNAVTSIKLTGPTAFSGDANSNWYGISNGNLKITGAKAGDYTLTIIYNDQIAIVEGDPAGMLDWTSKAITMTIPFTIRPNVSDYYIAGSTKDQTVFFNSKGATVVIPTASAADKTSTCVIDGIGWIVCSFTSFLATVTDGIYSLIENLLRVPKINTNIADGKNGVYNTWVVMRNIANIGFVIGFLIIIFSQMTSMGVSNYGVKKTLPRLIVAAILVNISYWVCAIAVDLSNIAGTGVYQILNSVTQNMNIGISGNWGNIIGGLLAGSAITAGAAGVAVGAVSAVLASGGGLSLLFLAIPLVLSAVLAVFIAAFILIARQALVVILIIISPLAFVALLLPNTEKLFDKWRSALISLLLLFPIVSMVVGGSQIAGLAIMSTAGTGTDPITTILPIIIGQAVIVIPFFFIPMLISRFSGDNLKGLVSTLNSRGKGLIGGISGAARKQGQARLGTALKTIKYGDNAPKGRLAGAFRKYGRKFDQSQDRRGMADSTLSEERQSVTRARLGTDVAFATGAGAGSYAVGQQVASRAQAAAEAEELKKALQPLVRELAGMDPEHKGDHLNDEVAAGGARAAAALHYSASIGDDGFLRKHIDTAKSSGNTELSRQAFEAVQANSGALLGKAPDLVKGADAAFKSLKGAQLATMSEGGMQALANHIQSLSTTASTITDPAKAAAAALKLDTAIAGLNSAAQDVANDVQLQGNFTGTSGLALRNATAGFGPALQVRIQPALDHIKGDGKIRP